jgi:hypothetical protein
MDMAWPVFANEKNKEPDIPLVLKLEATSMSFEGLRAYLIDAAAVMKARGKLSYEECRRLRLPLTGSSVNLSTYSRYSIDRDGRTTFKEVAKVIGLLALIFLAIVGVVNVSSLRSSLAKQKQQAQQATSEFVNFYSSTRDEYLRGDSKDPAFNAKAERENLRQVNKIIVEGIIKTCASDYGDPRLEAYTRDFLYYECIECKTRLETAKSSREFWAWVYAERKSGKR